NLFGSLSYRDDVTTSLDLNVNYANTDLIGNGAIPIEFAKQDYDGIFTSPDQTFNEMIMVQAQGSHWYTDDYQVAGNVFYRRTETDTFNGDGTEFEECTVDGDEVLVEADEDELEGLNCAGGITSAQLAAIGGEIVENQNGVAISDANGFEPDDLNALQNRSDRTQEYWGFTVQNALYGDLFDKPNQLITGAGYTYGDVVFNSSQELAELNGDRSTRGTNNFVPDEGTALDSEVSTMSLFFTDTFSATEKLDLTFSTRWNHTNVKLTDKGGRGFTRAQPALTGEHEFHRVNPAVGLTYEADSGLNSYFSYSESSRAPTAVELACAEPTAPCSLPNGFLADPPLDQVVAKSFEGGFRGSLSENVRFNIGAFYTPINNDIIFQNTGGVSGNQGFFDNVSDTLRQGIELGLTGQSTRFDWFLNYSLVQATFESNFEVTSANHSLKDANDLIQVQAGDFIPGIPEHTLKVGGDYAFTQAFSVGGDLQYNSGVFVRGDESNQLGRLDDYETVNIRSKYQVNKTFKLFARVDNLLDKEYFSFGLLGEPNEVPGFESFTDNRFVGVGAPRSVVIGVSASF
ncbi:MAG: TonB-dependent receptor, partial [Betaproteobacteria bacterium]|nr:TonB-dependent receptor [Betaproteobacteria bacterium]